MLNSDGEEIDGAIPLQTVCRVPGRSSGIGSRAGDSRSVVRLPRTCSISSKTEVLRSLPSLSVRRHDRHREFRRHRRHDSRSRPRPLPDRVLQRPGTQRRSGSLASTVLARCGICAGSWVWYEPDDDGPDHRGRCVFDELEQIPGSRRVPLERAEAANHRNPAAPAHSPRLW